MFGGDDDFDFIPDMDGDGDHDMMDLIILDTILSGDEKREEDDDEDDIFDTSDSEDDWRDEHDEGYEYDVDPNDYDTEDEYLDALEEAKYGWRETYEDDTDYDVDPEDYETEEEYLEALEEAKTAWRNDCEDGSDFGLDPEYYDTKEEYEEALEKAKYAWRENAEDGAEFGIHPENYETEDDYEQALEEAKYAWRESVEDGSDFDIFPEDFDSEEEYTDALETAKAEFFSWRNKYKDAPINPSTYATEEEYLDAVETKKFGWRKYCSNRFGILATDFETREEYNAAVSAAYEEERKRKIAEREADPTNMTIYKFCKVCVDYPNKPFYYYFTGHVKLQVGDRVLVPFGQNNKATEGIVMAVGECYGCALPCKVDLIKHVECKIESDPTTETNETGPFVFKKAYDCCYRVGETVYAKCRITDISISISGTTATIEYLTEKTFDKDGDQSTKDIFYVRRIIDDRGVAQLNKSVYCASIKVGEKSQGRMIFYDIIPGRTYEIEFLDEVR